MVLATEAFGKLVKVTLSARKMPDALAIVLKGNPEFLDEKRLVDLSDKVLDEAMRRLTTGTGSCEKLVE